MTMTALNRSFVNGFVIGILTTVLVYSSLDQDVQEEVDEEAVTILKYGIPNRGADVKYYTNHALSYDQAKKIPLWVAEHITKADLEGDASRKSINFVMDQSLDPLFRSQNSDYRKSGFSRGHMNPAADNKYNQKAMVETFYLSNVVPQDIQNNGGFWNKLEIYCRNLTSRYQDVRVISGPVMLPSRQEDGENYVKYKVIGKNSVAVPTHLFKIIAVENSSDSYQQKVAVGVFVVPNQPIAKDETLKTFQVDLEFLEKTAGIRFMPLLDMTRTPDLCKIDGCGLSSNRRKRDVGEKLYDQMSREGRTKTYPYPKEFKKDL